MCLYIDHTHMMLPVYLFSAFNIESYLIKCIRTLIFDSKNISFIDL